MATNASRAGRTGELASQAGQLGLSPLGGWAGPKQSCRCCGHRRNSDRKKNDDGIGYRVHPVPVRLHNAVVQACRVKVGAPSWSVTWTDHVAGHSWSGNLEE